MYSCYLICYLYINIGCPQKIAKRGNYGAYLLPDKQRIVSLLSAMVNELDCPITCKIRVLSTEEETLDLCHAIQDTGVSMLTVHGRTVESNKLFVGPANWDIIKKIKQSLTIPVIANGGISCLDDAMQCLAITGVDGVMSSEALLENPKLFSVEGDRLFREEYVRSQLDTVNEFIKILTSHRLPRPTVCVTRSHLFKLLHRFITSSTNIDLREKLATGDFQCMLQVINELNIRMSVIDYDTKIAEERGMIGKTSWYYRHRDEKAANRILSTPRRRNTKVPFIGRNSMQTIQPISQLQK